MAQGWASTDTVGSCQPPASPSESGSKAGDFLRVLWGRSGAGGQAESPGHRGLGPNLGLSLRIVAGEGGHSGPKAPWKPSLPLFTPEGLPDSPSPASLSPQPLPLISQSEEILFLLKQGPDLGGEAGAVWGISPI